MPSRAWRRQRGPLSVGVALSVLTGAAWVTAVPYLLVRAGGPSPVRLAVVDGVHAYVGLALLASLILKIAVVGFGRRVPGVGRLTIGQRWLAAGLGVLVAAVVGTGVAAAAAGAGPLGTELAHAHLIAAVWAAVPATVHVWGHRNLIREGAGWLGWILTVVVILVVGGAVAAPFASSASGLSADGAGAVWRRQGPPVFLDQLVRCGPDLVAGGAGLYVGVPRAERAASGHAASAGARPSGTVSTPVGAGGREGTPERGWTWTRRGPFDDHRLVLGLAGPVGPLPFVVGATDGLWTAPNPSGPFRRLDLAAGDVRSTVWFDDRIWVTSDSGVWNSPDGGRTWAPAGGGLRSPQTSWALAAFNGSLYASDETAVYRWAGDTWRTESQQGAVVNLDAFDRLYSSSMGQGIEYRPGNGGWTASNGGLGVHQHGAVRGVHMTSVQRGPRGVLYAGSMLEGPAVSNDAGRSWDLPWPGLGRNGVVWRVLPVGSTLLAATDAGLLEYPLHQAPAASWAWWIRLMVLAGASGPLTAAGSTAYRLRPWPRRREALPSSDSSNGEGRLRPAAAVGGAPAAVAVNPRRGAGPGSSSPSSS